MQRASTGDRLTRGNRSRQERVGESQLVLIELEDSCLERLLDPLLRGFGEHVLDQRGGRLRDGGYDSGNVECAPIEVGETLSQELVERGGQWERITGCRGAAAPLQRFGQLEREERIPARRLPEPEQRRPRECHLEPPVEELAQCADAYSDDLERRQPLGQAPPEPFGRIAPHRQENGERPLAETGESEAERGGRSRVEPLEVVDRKADRGFGDEHVERRAERRRHGALVGHRIGLAQQQRGLERSPLDRGQLRQDIVDDPAEQVGQPRVRQPGLGLGGAARHDAVAVLVGRCDPGQPEGGLADPRLTVEDDRAGQLVGAHRAAGRSLRARPLCR